MRKPLLAELPSKCLLTVKSHSFLVSRSSLAGSQGFDFCKFNSMQQKQTRGRMEGWEGESEKQCGWLCPRPPGTATGMGLSCPHSGSEPAWIQNHAGCSGKQHRPRRHWITGRVLLSQVKEVTFLLRRPGLKPEATRETSVVAESLPQLATPAGVGCLRPLTGQWVITAKACGEAGRRPWLRADFSPILGAH